MKQKNNLLENNTKKPKNNGENGTLLGPIFFNIQSANITQGLHMHAQSLVV
jgi:hypothetical protein